MMAPCVLFNILNVNCCIKVNSTGDLKVFEHVKYPASSCLIQYSISNVGITISPKLYSESTNVLSEMYKNDGAFFVPLFMEVIKFVESLSRRATYVTEILLGNKCLLHHHTYVPLNHIKRSLT